MKIGKFRNLVEIKKGTQTRTPSMDFVPGEMTVHARRYASIETPSGREAERAKVVEAEVTHIVRIPTDSTVYQSTPDMQIHFDDKWLGQLRIFEILSIRNIDEENRLTEFMCKEKVA